LDVTLVLLFLGLIAMIYNTFKSGAI
jgi:hypothetical protein